MDFSISESLQSLLDRYRAFVREELQPMELGLSSMPFHELLVLIEEKRNQARKLGLWNPHLSKEHGGLGLSLLEFSHVAQELGRCPLGHYTFNCQAPDVGNMEVLIHFGTPAQQDKYLRPLTTGAIRSCFSMTEPGFPGSNPVRMGTTAVKDGDDYVINGRKWFTSSADGSEFAIVMAVTNPDDPSPYQCASQIIVPTATSGFNMVRNISVMGEPGEGYMSHSEIVYEDCRVPQANRIGPEGAGFKIAQMRLGPGRIHHCMRWIGICERAFDLMCERAVSRNLNPGEPLGSQQMVQQWVAESRAEINASRLMVLQAAWAIDQHGVADCRDEIAVIKFYVAGVLQRVLDRAIQTHGALGVTDDTPLAWWYRHERAARIYDGPDEVHKASVAKRILKRYASPRAS